MSAYAERTDETTVKFERLLPGPIERVWSYLVEPEKRMKWFCGGAFELKPGGVAQFHFNHSRIAEDKPSARFEKYDKPIEFDGTIVEANPPGLLVFDWPEEDGRTTRVSIELEEADEKVKLTLIHSRLYDRRIMADVSGGWHLHLDRLAALLAGEKPSPFWATMERLHVEYEERYE